MRYEIGRHKSSQLRSRPPHVACRCRAGSSTGSASNYPSKSSIGYRFIEESLTLGDRNSKNMWLNGCYISSTTSCCHRSRCGAPALRPPHVLPQLRLAHRGRLVEAFQAAVGQAQLRQQRGLWVPRSALALATEEGRRGQHLAQTSHICGHIYNSIMIPLNMIPLYNSMLIHVHSYYVTLYMALLIMYSSIHSIHTCR